DCGPVAGPTPDAAGPDPLSNDVASERPDQPDLPGDRVTEMADEHSSPSASVVSPPEGESTLPPYGDGNPSVAGLRGASDGAPGAEEVPEPSEAATDDEPRPAPIDAAPLPPATAGVSEALVRPIEPLTKTIYLTNARVGETYRAEIGVDGLRSVRMEDAGGTGLEFDAELGTISGLPLDSGDFRLVLRGLLDGRPTVVLANLAVIPDPKSLWVSIASDETSQFWKPDEHAETVDDALRLIAASKRGRSHAREGGCRDDDFALSVGPDGWHVATVADGAGSATYSRRGSLVAVTTVKENLPGKLVELLSPNLDKLIAAHAAGNPDAAPQIRSLLYQSLAAVAFQAAQAIEEEAAKFEAAASAFSTTLIICVARQVADGWFFAGFSVGDGGAALLDLGENFVMPLTQPDSGEFAGQTRFLQRSEFAGGYEEVSKRIFFTFRRGFTALALMTDGITDPKFPTETVFADPNVWRDFWLQDLTNAVDFSRANPEAQAQFLQWLDFWSPGNHDDRTLAILIP
ncbi:MAG: protein phosphatase 2C domain-containing protein, partial [Candidatus Nanopelagicales bacterium]